MTSTSLTRPSPLSHAVPQSLVGKGVICVAASIFVAFCAHCSLPMPFTPVPTTLQTFAVILVGMILGPSGGFAALTLYLVEGTMGLPVFSPHGPGGMLQMLGPTAGYLFAYPLAAALAGICVRVYRRFLTTFPGSLFASLTALFPIFCMGALWLQHVLHLSGSQTLHLAIMPFLGAELVKLIAASTIYTGLRLSERPRSAAPASDFAGGQRP